MSTSGTAAFGLTLDEVIAEGCERALIEPSSLAAPQLVSLMRSVNLALIEFENCGQPLYRLDNFDLALTANIRGYRLPLGTLDVLTGMTRSSTNVDQQLERMSREDYLGIADKTATGDPSSFFVSFDVTDTGFLQSISSDLTDPTELTAAYDPTASTAMPVLVLYPCPDATGTFIGTRIRQHQDAAQLNEHVDLQRLWLDALCAAIAKRAAEKYNRPLYLECAAVAKQALYEAKLESGSRAPVVINYSASRRR